MSRDPRFAMWTRSVEEERKKKRENGGGEGVFIPPQWLKVNEGIGLVTIFDQMGRHLIRKAPPRWALACFTSTRARTHLNYIADFDSRSLHSD